MTSPAVPAACAARFKPQRKIAEGGFGSVWYAMQVGLARPVALKILHAELVEEQEQVQRFMTEARVTAALRHPHVVTLIDHGVEDGVPWIAYEFVPGESLRARLSRGALPWREACDVASQVAAALEAAHAQGVLHRDIKPDNILSSEQGHYKVADFGIAKVRAGHALTARGVILGTPSYLSPVQIRGEAPGPDSDVYALGITLYELLTGQPPFAGSTPMDTLSEHLTAQIPHVSQVVPDVPPELDELLVKMLAKKRSERMGNAAEVRAALAQLLVAPLPPPVALGSGRARRPSSRAAGDTLPSGVAPMIGAVARPSLVAPEAPRRRWPLAAAGGALVAIAAAFSLEPAPGPLPSPVAVASVAPCEIPDLHAEPLARSIRVSIRRPPGARIALEMRRGDLAWEPRGTLDGEGDFHAREITGLEPDTAYHVRARCLDGPGETPPVFVRTLRDVEVRATPDPSKYEHIERGALRADLLEVLPVSVPDPRVVSFLIKDLESPPTLRAAYVHAVAQYAWRTPSRPLAEALFKVPDLGDEGLRAEIVGLASYVGLPGAPEAARELMARCRNPMDLWPLMHGFERTRSPELFDAAETFVRRNLRLLGSYAAAVLVALDPARARAVFEDWACKAGPDGEAERQMAAIGFGLLPGARTLAQLDGIARRLPPASHRELMLALAFHRRDPEAARIARGLQPGEDLRAVYYAAVLGVADPVGLKLRLDGPNVGMREQALRALVAMPPGTIPPALLERADVADLAAFSYAGVTDPAALAALRARALSDRDRSGVALWALARSHDPAAGPRALELLREPVDDPHASGRQAIAAWVAGDLLLAEAKDPLKRLAASNLTPFARQCVRDSLAWIAAGRAPLSFMVPAGLVYVPAGVPLKRQETLWIECSELLPPGAKKNEVDLENIAGSLNPIVAHAGAGPILEEVKKRARAITVRCDGELVISRAVSLDTAIGGFDTSNLLRVVIQR